VVREREQQQRDGLLLDRVQRNLLHICCTTKQSYKNLTTQTPSDLLVYPVGRQGLEPCPPD
jgi:hypothetical protein